MWVLAWAFNNSADSDRVANTGTKRSECEMNVFYEAQKCNALLMFVSDVTRNLYKVISTKKAEPRKDFYDGNCFWFVCLSWSSLGEHTHCNIHCISALSSNLMPPLTSIIGCSQVASRSFRVWLTDLEGTIEFQRSGMAMLSQQGTDKTCLSAII